MKINLDRPHVYLPAKGEIGILEMYIESFNCFPIACRLWNCCSYGFEYVRHEILVLKK